VSLSTFQEEFSLKNGGNSVAEFANSGNPAVVESTYKNGKTIIVGTFLGLVAHDEKTCGGDTNAGTNKIFSVKFSPVVGREQCC
jgi:hypothetical protein